MSNTEKMAASGLKRRDFLKLAGIAGGGLVLGFHLPGEASAQSAGPVDLNAYIQIRPDGMIRIYAPQPEVGQGVKTSLPLIVAEELDAAWDTVVIEQAPVAPSFGFQFAGGSFTTPTRFMPLRQTGAAARAMLVEAAAQNWGVPADGLTTSDNVVTNPATGETLAYGALAELAATLPEPDPATLRLKDRSQWKLLGRRVPGVDNPKIVTGQPLYGIDVVVPDMKYATYVRAPRLGSKVISANLDEVKALPGVTDAVIIDGHAPNSRLLVPGVAVIANSTWAAFQAAKRVKVEWDESEASTDDWETYQAQARELAPQAGAAVIAEAGDFEGKFAAAPTKVESFYEYPFLYHSPLEPMNCTAHSKPDGTVELWAPTQMATGALTDVATALNLLPAGTPPQDAAAQAGQLVTLHQTRMGGGFGRRLFNDFVCEAAAISRAAGNIPIKLTYTREDDTTHGLYRPGGFHYLKGAIDADRKLSAWQDHFVTFAHPTGEVLQFANITPDEFPMGVLGDAKIMQSTLTALTRGAAMRAPRSNGVAYVTQSFFHELSVAAGRDHREFLLELLGEPREIRPPAPAGAPPGPPGPAFHTGRMAAALNLVCERAGWGREMPPGSALGCAFYYCHSGHVAAAAEVSVDENKRVRVPKIWIAADVGPIVNMSAAESQCQGSAIDGYGLAAGLAITLRNGVVQQTNFHQYPLIRMPSAPQVEVSFIQSDYPPTGLGEPALPPTIPAVCNAIFTATGERIRSLPFSQHGFSI